MTTKKIENPAPDEKVCFNCEHMMWMVGLGLGVKCRINRMNIPSRLYTCEKFEKKVINNKN
jgi:hypothetical protein